ncbi:FKBP-type peptidyl-prolyl cis-trans isomerase [Streptomyces sp. H10-C2]|uniref:FKBP-type peptidyl-prolyl cis-trans isomerase n=1 Tax=unclassified Streptomyces TaxID=2593676 RepID=UPI0024BBACE2|nr:MULTISPECIES: FKBP-type peptidyl-prolyl cis-trans isomerase [unclassified Streptomyces]MDJ0343779.1 FKBP-type peptidyl-prolyl cis-trans isomerase [Streptomyces sp. PH10-H1]MDJ0373300.1 FKBP-type peptidyl-prolyl cis-trans isomerase [Streptomyces sp. H10-C2]
MRRLAALLVVPVLLLTAACGSDKGNSNSAAFTSKMGLPSITAGVKIGEKPTIAKGEGDPPKELKVEVVSKGSGAKVAKGQNVQVNYLGQTWTSDKPFDNSFDRKQSFPLTIGAGGVIKGWDQGLEGQNVGSRVMLGIPPALGYGAQAQGTTIPANSTLVFVVDILKATTVPTSAKGTEVKQDDAKLPQVGTNTDGKAPTVTIPKVDPPKALVSNYVIEGSGPVVKATDGVVIQYEGFVWKDGSKFDDGYATGKTTSIPALNQLQIKGLVAGLTGKKIGSRLLLVLPPSEGFGDKAQTGVPANSTVVFSLDILALL